MTRTTERQLIMPALRLIATHGTPDKGLEVGQLRALLRSEISPWPDDLVILAGRKDDRLSQVIRNLVSHRTLEKQGLATYRKDTALGLAFYNLTPMGWATVTPNPTSIYRYKS
jgi:hypothetical protein